MKKNSINGFEQNEIVLDQVKGGYWSPTQGSDGSNDEELITEGKKYDTIDSEYDCDKGELLW
ncbi:hypothetical protein GCM10009118_28880 [Wandonia haliotis]|uniref:Uncharacterized protein n=1 Tax=Wandonia haliotis TaxID=574963 RepID=A0ABN1MT16_9FLAO